MIGVRGIWLIALTLALLLPVNFAWMFIYVRLFPPKFEEYKTGDTGRKSFK